MCGAESVSEVSMNWGSPIHSHSGSHVTFLGQKKRPSQSRDKTELKDPMGLKTIEPTQLMLANSSCYFLYLPYLPPSFPLVWNMKPNLPGHMDQMEKKRHESNLYTYIVNEGAIVSFKIELRYASSLRLKNKSLKVQQDEDRGNGHSWQHYTLLSTGSKALCHSHNIHDHYWCPQ